MSQHQKLYVIFACFLTSVGLKIVSAYGPYPYFESPYYPAYYPPPYPGYYPPSYYPPVPPPQSFAGYQTPKHVKPLHMSPSSQLILPRHGSNTPIIISPSKSRPPQPTLLSPLTNLINSFIRSLIPSRTSCDCDYDDC